MKKLFLVIMCLVFVYASANAKEGNNSRIQNLEAQVVELQNQINKQSVAAASASEEAEVVFELCNLFVLTDNTPPSFCRDCGNSKLELIEQCDDGNTAGGDGCSADCLWEECGNGIIDINEECDDGNDNDGDGCSFSCTTEYKMVFLTSNTYSGDLGGLDGADTICNDLAVEAGLHGTYKAWLSDSDVSVSERFTHSDLPYVLVDKIENILSEETRITIADDWIGLTSGDIRNRINRDEKLDTYGSRQSVWTNTQRDGEIMYTVPAKNCNNWSSSDSAYWGRYGYSFYTYYKWTNSTYDIRCNTINMRLYCFQD